MIFLQVRDDREVRPGVSHAVQVQLEDDPTRLSAYPEVVDAPVLQRGCFPGDDVFRGGKLVVEHL